MKYEVNGRELESYQLSNGEMVTLLKGETLAEEQRKELTKSLIARFERENCPRAGEDNHDVFARQFSDFVNGKCHNKKKTAELMARDHRYLQSEMFKVFMEYAKILAENYENGRYDGRNEWACTAAKYMTDGLKAADYPY